MLLSLTRLGLFNFFSIFSIDGYRWACTGEIKIPKKKSIPCRYLIRIRKDTFFYRSKLPIWKILGFAHFWLRNLQLDFIKDELNIAHNTSIDFAAFCREVVFDAMVLKGKTV